MRTHFIESRAGFLTPLFTRSHWALFLIVDPIFLLDNEDKGNRYKTRVFHNCVIDNLFSSCHYIYLDSLIPSDATTSIPSEEFTNNIDNIFLDCAKLGNVKLNMGRRVINCPKVRISIRCFEI